MIITFVRKSERTNVRDRKFHENTLCFSRTFATARSFATVSRTSVIRSGLKADLHCFEWRWIQKWDRYTAVVTAGDEHNFLSWTWIETSAILRGFFVWLHPSMKKWRYSSMSCVLFLHKDLSTRNLNLQRSTTIYNDSQWFTMIYNDLQWFSMIYNDLQWFTMFYNDLQWSIMV